MTSDELDAARKAGQTKLDLSDLGIDDSFEAPVFEDVPYSFEDFLPILVSLLPLIRHVTAAPTKTPKTFLECFAFMDDGVNRRAYFFINKTWRYAALT
jgi:hypothetical protein